MRLIYIRHVNQSQNQITSFSLLLCLVSTYTVLNEVELNIILVDSNLGFDYFQELEAIHENRKKEKGPACSQRSNFHFSFCGITVACQIVIVCY